MPATALPASGDRPDAPKICDASGMADIHRYFSAGFAEGPALVGGVRAGDTAHADTVATQLSTLSVSLHAHHEGEDERLWSTLDERAPSCRPHVERMKAQHAQMLMHLNELDAALPAWRTSASSNAAGPVLAALSGINGALAVHLPDEEGNIVPVMETTMTQPEVEWFGDHGRKATPKGQTWNTVGAILAAQPDGGGEWAKKNLPAPFRLIWRLIGKPRYEAHRAELTRP